jgi:hypothetical protein
MTDRPALIADGIDRLVAAIGRAVAWLALAIVLVQFAVVVLRYAFGIGSIWLSESVIYGHATMFMLAAAWTLQAGGHVRVDIFYADASPKTKAIVDLLGARDRRQEGQPGQGRDRLHLPDDRLALGPARARDELGERRDASRGGEVGDLVADDGAPGLATGQGEGEQAHGGPRGRSGRFG